MARAHNHGKGNAKKVREARRVSKTRMRERIVDLYQQQRDAIMRRLRALIQDPRTLPAALVDIGSAFSAVRGEFRKNRRRALADAYGLAAVMRANPDCWREFCRLREWQEVRNRPNVDRPEEALAHTMRFVHGLGNRAGQKRASTVVVALTPLWNRQTPASEIETAIRKGGGTTEMAKAARAQLRAERRAKGDRITEVVPEIAPDELPNRHSEFLKILQSAEKGQMFTLTVKKSRDAAGELRLRIMELKEARRR